MSIRKFADFKPQKVRNYRFLEVSVLLYHLVFPEKYRGVGFDKNVDEVLKEVCIKIEDRYQIKFLEIGTDKDHVHLLAYLPIV